MLCIVENLDVRQDGTFAFAHIGPGVEHLYVTKFRGHTLPLIELDNLSSIKHFTLEHSKLTELNLTMTAEKSSVSISYSTVSSITFFRCRGITIVNVLRTLLDSIPVTLYEQTSLEELSIQQTRIDTVDLDLMANLTRLRFLNLSDNRIKTVSITMETGCYPRLRSMQLQNNLLTEFDFGQLAHMTCLDAVSFRSNRLRSVENTFRDNSTSALHLLRCVCSPEGKNETEPSPPFGRLDQIDLDSNRMTELNFSVFTPMRRLTEIRLGHNLLTSVSVASDLLPPKLAFVDLSYNRLENADLADFMTIRSVDIGSNRMKPSRK